MAAKEFALHFAEQMQAVEPLQVVEAVAVLELLHLHFEDEVEGRAEHAAERQDLLGQAADPQIDVVEAAQGVGCSVGTGAVEEVHRHPSDTSKAADRLPGDDGQRRVTLAIDGRLAGDQLMSCRKQR